MYQVIFMTRWHRPNQPGNMTSTLAAFASQAAAEEAIKAFCEGRIELGSNSVEHSARRLYAKA